MGFDSPIAEKPLDRVGRFKEVCDFRATKAVKVGVECGLPVVKSRESIPSRLAVWINSQDVFSENCLS
jgi:hypothetical protein